MADRIKTVKSSGGDYSSLAAAEAGEQGNISAGSGSNEVVRLQCFAFQDTTAVAFAGWTTDATGYISVEGQVAPGASWNTSAYRLVVSAASGQVILIDQPWTRMSKFQADNTGNKDDSSKGIVFGSTITSSVMVTLEDFHVRASGANAPAGFTFGIWHQGGASTWRMRNGIVASFRVGIATPSAALDMQWYNLTIVNNALTGVGADTSSGSVRHWKNILCNGNSPDWSFSGSATNDYATNISEDTSSPTVGLRSKAVTFVNEAGGDWHLDPSDTAAKDAGTDLSADATWPFSTDSEGNTRSGSWDIGADEYTSSGDTATPSSSIATWAVAAATIVLGGITALPSPATAAWAVPSATVVTAVAPAPSPAISLWSAPAPSVSLGGVTAAPGPSTSAWISATPSTSQGDVTASPPPSTSTWSSPTSSASPGGIAPAPSPSTSAWSALDAVFTEGAIGTPSPATAVWSVPAASPSVGGVTATPAGGGGTWSVPTATVASGGVSATPSPATSTWAARDASFGDFTLLVPDGNTVRAQDRRTSVQAQIRSTNVEASPMTLDLVLHLTLEKHRQEIEDYAVDFRAGGRLASGETLSGTPTVKVFREASGADTDVSSEFGITSQGTSGDKVIWRMGLAGSGQQDAGEYVLRVSCATSTGRAPVSIHRFTVSETGDSAAP